jgi:hypothetical protein
MKLINITSGNFNTSGKKNFSGYDLTGQRIFVAKERMEAFGIKTDAEFNAKAKAGGIWVCAVEKEYNVVNSDGEVTDEKFTRLTATALFETQDQAIQAKIASQLVDIKADSLVQQERMEQASALNKKATELGLTQEFINKLATASL